ncbi:MAG: 6-carboxytetrahydropterin synthase QueD [Oscillospiraceae bacterium]|nr:6-carboxytetrahydropterin synthase QueD [Oscillospiraceae bacterium]
MVLYELSGSVHFDAAHFLLDYDGKCKNLHGHRYTVKYTVSSSCLTESGARQGMVCDFSDIKEIVGGITDPLDHKILIYACKATKDFTDACHAMGFETAELDFQTTAENLACYIYRRVEQNLKNDNIYLKSIEVFETPTNSVLYSEQHRENNGG